MAFGGSTRIRRSVLVAVLIAAAVAAFALLRPSVAGRDADDGERSDREHPIVTAPRVAQQDGHSVVRLDATALQRAGIRTQAVQRTAQPEMSSAFATVIDLQPLVELSGAARAAVARLAAAQARVAASRAAFERAARLYDDQQNISAAQLQAARAAYEADRAAVVEAQAQLEASRASARVGWGAALADALGAPDEHTKSLADDLLAHRQVLLQVTLPPASGQEPDVERAPAHGRVALQGHPGPALVWVGAAARADPRMAGRSYFYRAVADAALLPGATLPVQLETGRRIEAARVPASAVVWWQGQPWIYARARAGDFERRPVPVDGLRDAGWLSTDLPAGTDVVVQGAQVLLSEELRAENFSTDVGGR